jgi:hypothetical protein
MQVTRAGQLLFHDASIWGHDRLAAELGLLLLACQSDPHVRFVVGYQFPADVKGHGVDGPGEGERTRVVRGNW